VQPASKGSKEHTTRSPRGAASDYHAKVAHEISHLSRLMKDAGHPAPLGDPASGVVLVVEQPVGPRVLKALDRSIKSVGLPQAYVTYASTGLLAQELLAAEPRALVAVGPGAAREIDALGHPLAQRPFSRAETGAWFAWTQGTAGLRLPSLILALDDDGAKRGFWRAFLALRNLIPAP
jgi:hypothetical protein